MTAPSLPPFVTDGCPCVSAVMPTYNRAELMRESVKAILNQTMSNFELIISDDHSTDQTSEVAAELTAFDSRVRYHRLNARGGVAFALNEAILLSCGRYIQVCHDHDIYYPTLLEKMTSVLNRYPSVAFVHPGTQGCDHLGNPLPNRRFVMGYPEVTDGLVWRRKMLKRLACPVIALSMIRRTALEAVGLFDPAFGVSTDVELWLRLCAVGDVGYVNDLLILVRGRDPEHPNAGINWQVVDEVIRAHRKHLELTYRGLEYGYWKLRKELEIDGMLLFNFLNSVRHRRRRDVKLGQAYLRRYGPFFSRLAGWLLGVGRRWFLWE
jgi:glycosyltransferase involved in cell wall biosynthesis